MNSSKDNLNDDRNDDSSSGSNKLFVLTIEKNGEVTTFHKVENGITTQGSIDNSDSFVINGGDAFIIKDGQITHIKQTANGPEVTVFSDSDGDDFIVVSGGQGADKFVFREAAHLRIEDFSSQEGDKLVFDTGLGLTSKEHLASFITDIHTEGENLIVDFGRDASITLIGVKPDQISFDHVDVLS